MGQVTEKCYEYQGKTVELLCFLSQSFQKAPTTWGEKLEMLPSIMYPFVGAANALWRSASIRESFKAPTCLQVV